MRDKIVVLMSTYNGEKYIKEQLNSLIDQEDVEVKILVRDDGSTDNTVEILKQYHQEGKLDYYIGENMKPAGSFMDLIFNAPNSEYYAFCDQDDFWKKNKLSEGIKRIKKYNGSVLYYCGMNIVDENLVKYGEYHRNEKFANSLKYTSVFGGEISGCTMILNQSLMKKIRKYHPKYITMHDTWIHRVSLAVNSKIIADKNCYIDYRQHSNNVIGFKKNNLYKRIKLNKNKCKKIANEILCGYSDELNNENKKFLETLIKDDLLSKFKIAFYKFEFKIGFVKRLKMNLKVFLGIL